jgi:hypothetical protein
MALRQGVRCSLDMKIANWDGRGRSLTSPQAPTSVKG